MPLTEYLLIALLAAVLTGAGALLKAVRQAIEGYEDESGFHFGPTPAWVILLGPIAEVPSTAYAPDTSARANPPAEVKPEGRNILGSKPPMLPADLQAEDLKPQSDKSSQASAGTETT